MSPQRAVLVRTHSAAARIVIAGGGGKVKQENVNYGMIYLALPVSAAPGCSLPSPFGGGVEDREII